MNTTPRVALLAKRRLVRGEGVSEVFEAIQNSITSWVLEEKREELRAMDGAKEPE